MSPLSFRSSLPFRLLVALLLLSAGLFYFQILRQPEKVQFELPLPFEVQERLCLPGHCFEVVDHCIDKGEEGRRFEVVERWLEEVLLSGKRDPLTRVQLHSDRPNASFWDSDTRLWRVETASLVDEATKGMVMGAFLTGTIEARKKTQKLKVLFLGLGGGATASHLKAIKEGVEAVVVEKEKSVAALAKKWFPLNDVAVVVDDPLEWLRREGKEEGSFDAVFVDESVSASLSTTSSLSLIVKQLKKSGQSTVVLNFWNGRNKSVEKDLDSLLGLLPMCLSLSFTAESNTVVACSTRSLPHFDTAYPVPSLNATLDGVLEVYDKVENDLAYGDGLASISLHTKVEGKRRTVTENMRERKRMPS